MFFMGQVNEIGRFVIAWVLILVVYLISFTNPTLTYVCRWVTEIVCNNAVHIA